MPYTKILVHAVWSTKNRLPLLTADIRPKVFQHIHENAKTKGIDILIINGFKDHCHCIINLNSNQNMATVMNLLKGEVSYWINKQKLSPTKFEWQDEYFAVSFNLSQLEKVKQYILNQEIHHTMKTYQQEYDDFVLKFEFDK